MWQLTCKAQAVLQGKPLYVSGHMKLAAIDNSANAALHPKNT